ncbi:FG-nucleoporin NUP116 PWA37_005080 [Arxiozyma heterogenica]|uniref:FG-nucleoporin NUP116 n=1 Tax=Arxiozyma heterogenica TaxID=278026 RepID=UPI002EFEC0AC
MFGNMSSNPTFGNSVGNSLFSGNTSNNNTTNTGFGASTTNHSPFGMNNNAINNNGIGNSLFGGGGMSNNNNNTGSSIFGQPNNIMNSGSSLFGNNNNNSTNNQFGMIGGANSNNNLMGTGNGTAIKPFAPFLEKDPTTNTMNSFQSITFMPEYRNYSFEELRLQDYRANRRFPNSGTAATTTNQFGNTSTTSTATGGGLFGQQNSTGGLFGQQNNNINTGSGLFGQQNNNNNNMNSGGLFGQQQNNSFNTTSRGLFGQNNNSSNNMSPFGNNQQISSGLFGQNNNSNTNSGGLFGQQQNPFGSNNNNTNTTGGLFGQQSNNNNNMNSGGLFGQKPISTTGGGLFGQQQSNVNSSSGGLFGQQSSTAGGFYGQQNNNNNNTMSSGGLFGQKPMGATGGGLFGQSNMNNNNNNTNTGGGLFGQQNNNNMNNGGLFGQQQSSTTTGGLFGQSNVNNNTNSGAFNQLSNANSGGLFGQQNTATSGGLFGQSNATNTSTGGGLFGQQNNIQQPATGGLFGSKPLGSTSTSLFGNNTAQQQQQTGLTGGLFGAKPSTTSTGGLFGNINNNNNNNNSTLNAGGATGGLFGTSTLGGTNTVGSTTTNSLFGSKPATSFGSTTNSFNTSTSTSGLFGNKPTNTFNSGNAGAITGGLNGSNSTTLQTSNPSQSLQLQQLLPQLEQQKLYIRNNPYGTDELFSKLSNGSTLIEGNKADSMIINADLKMKASLATAYRMAPKTLFAVKDLKNTENESSIKTIAINSAKQRLSIANEAHNSSDSSMSKNIEDVILNADKLLFNPDRRSFKNLIINRKMMEEDKRTQHEEATRKAIEYKADSDEKEKNIVLEDIKETSAPDRIKEPDAIESPKSIKGELDNMLKPKGCPNADFSWVDDSYYISPSMDTLSLMTLLQLKKVRNLVIGNKYFGFIEFLDPVDLSDIPLASLCGRLVRFEQKSCIIYPDASRKPEPGSGINVRARITCYNCYPVDKETRTPVKDKEHQLVKRHIRQLKEIPHTKFEHYDVSTGDYVFTVANAVL